MRDREIATRIGDEFVVAVLGDSFTWGWGASYGERFTEVIEALNPRIDAWNFGVSGYGPVQYLLQLDHVLSLAPDHVVLVFSLGSDLTDNIVSAHDAPKPYAMLTANSQIELIGYPLEYPRPREPQPRHSTLQTVNVIARALDRLGTQLYEGEPPEEDLIELAHTPKEQLTSEQRWKVEFMYVLNEAVIKSMAAKVERQLGKDRFTILLAPSKYEYGLGLDTKGAIPGMMAERMLESMARLNVPTLDGRLAIDPADFWPIDGHWKPSGHKRIGVLLNSYLSKLASLNKTAGPATRD
jgi:hypothetical protein